METNTEESYVRLTASCEIAVGNVGSKGGWVVLGIAQRVPEGVGVTTVLLQPDSARELASVLLRHSAANRADDE